MITPTLTPIPPISLSPGDYVAFRHHVKVLEGHLLAQLSGTSGPPMWTVKLPNGNIVTIQVNNDVSVLVPASLDLDSLQREAADQI